MILFWGFSDYFGVSVILFWGFSDSDFPSLIEHGGFGVSGFGVVGNWVFKIIYFFSFFFIF